MPAPSRATWLAGAAIAAAVLGSLPVATAEPPGKTLPGTKALRQQGDLAAQMVAGVDRFLLRELERSLAKRQVHWNRDLRDDDSYRQSVAVNRQRLASILGIDGDRRTTRKLRWSGSGPQASPVARSERFAAYAVSWPTTLGVEGEGLLLLPSSGTILADVVAIPDADQPPEQIAGLIEGIPPASQFARRLAASGCRVLIPTLISRERQLRAAPGRESGAVLTNREYLYRPTFELGLHLIGYEIEKIRAGIDWLRESRPATPLGAVGYGEGGLLCLYTAALDERIAAAAVSGYFGSRQRIWEEPIDRNQFGLLNEFSDAEIATLVAPRNLIVEGGCGPRKEIPGEGGAPSKLRPQSPAAVRGEWQRMQELLAGLSAVDDPNSPSQSQSKLLISSPAAFCDAELLEPFMRALGMTRPLHQPNQPLDALVDDFGIPHRQRRQVQQIVDHSQARLHQSSYQRADFLKDLKTDSLENFQRSVESYRDYFRDQVIGEFDLPRLPPRPRSRLRYDEGGWRGYEVVLDVFPDVFAYGILCIPKELRPGERRPVVVCQHGLEGRPRDVVTGDARAYHDFASKLAEQGFVTFAPQNLYIGKDSFRTLQRKANPLGKTLFSVIVPQHQQIVDWLQQLDFVDPERIAFYGLSYGGKSAMRIPPLVPDYCLSICSADFNDWVRKCASTRSPYSYVFTGEYEIFEWNLGGTFNYAEMAALIAPRPFMVERGHFDGVAPDEWVAAEFAKVRHLYQAQLGIGDRCEIEWFVGPHTINGEGTFEFLHRHLKF